jgi:hypothetical protein
MLSVFSIVFARMRETSSSLFGIGRKDGLGGWDGVSTCGRLCFFGGRLRKFERDRLSVLGGNKEALLVWACSAGLIQ